MFPAHPVSNFGVMAGGSQYITQDAYPIPVDEREPVSALTSPGRRQHPHPQPQSHFRENRRNDERTETSSSIRRRISRACDQCNHLRTKCHGGNPCAHCVGRYYAISPQAWADIYVRFWSRLRVLSRTKETGQSVAERSGRATIGRLIYLRQPCVTQ